jgi:opacity protein-like surface antigen
MKKLSRSLACALGAGVLSLLAFNSFGQANHFYAKFDVGGGVAADMDLKEFFGESVGNGTIELDPGLRLGVAGGYWVTDWFAPEVELGAVMNSIKNFGGSSQVEAAITQLPLMINAKFQLPNKTIATPYAGAGAGFSTTVLTADHLQLGGTYVDGSQADAVFCWQAFAGVRFTLADNMGLSLEYRFLAADGANWQAENVFGTTTDRIAFGDAKIQTVSIAFDWRF